MDNQSTTQEQNTVNTTIPYVPSKKSSNNVGNLIIGIGLLATLIAAAVLVSVVVLRRRKLQSSSANPSENPQPQAVNTPTELHQPPSL